ncbi:MAG: response regulator [Aquimonas sp.]|jgi:two-component system OmpR family response regulator
MSSAKGEGLRLLHVEDDPAIRAIARIALTQVGQFTLLSCASGAEALEAAPGFDPHILLLDVMMPGMDGPTTLSGLAERMPLDDRLVMFMTAKVQPSDIESYRARGAQGVIVKPFDAMRLYQTVLDEWQAVRERHDRA